MTRITVSRYLRTPELLAEDTRERVREAIERIGYVPNQQAGQLASGRSRIVAALVPTLGYSVFAETVQGLSEGLQGSGYELMLMSTGYSPEREEQQLRAVLGWSPSGLVLTGRRHSRATEGLVREARGAGVPVVEIWDRPSNVAASDDALLVGFDHAAIGAQMAEHLLALGHRRLAYVDSATADDYRARERQKGFEAAARNAGVRALTLGAAAGDGFDAGRQALRELLAATPRPTGLAFASDWLAGGALHEAREQGLRVPEQLSLLGFGDLPHSRHLQPALSTVHTPNAEIGRTAAAAVRAALSSPAAGGSATLDCQLVLRASTGPAPAAG